MTIHANITAHKSRYLIIELLVNKSIDGEVATSLDNPGNFGQIIMDTGKHLGVSQEALALLKKIRKGSDSLGDLDWFRTNGGAHAFGWIGGPKRIVDTSAQITGSRDYTIGEFVEIENLVPEEAKEILDRE